MGHTNYWITKTYKEIGNPDYELEFAFRARDVLNEINNRLYIKHDTLYDNNNSYLFNCENYYF